MKIYEMAQAPNARRVRIFLAEKKIPMEYVQIDLAKGEQTSDEFKEKNMMAKIPVLELDDGTHISESVAICRYFEQTSPETPLFGTDAKEQAIIEMWQRRAELNLLFPIGMCFQHLSEFFKERITQVPQWGEVSKKAANANMNLLDSHLKDSTYLAGDNFSIADITALCAIDFGRTVKIAIPDDCENLKRWYDMMSERDSSKA